jgi:protein SCO1/2
MPSRSRFLFAAALLAIALAIAGAAMLSSRQLPEPSGSGTALVGGAFALTDQTGRRVTDRDFMGRYMLVFFGYSSCPDICPAELQVMSAALDQLGTAGDSVTPIFISVDPERDRPETLRQFAARFHPRLVALTGTPEEIADVARAYRVSYRRTGPETSGSTYEIDHTLIIYLMGPDGKFIRHFTYTTDAGALARAIAKAISG